MTLAAAAAGERAVQETRAAEAKAEGDRAVQEARAAVTRTEREKAAAVQAARAAEVRAAEAKAEGDRAVKAARAVEVKAVEVEAEKLEQESMLHEAQAELARAERQALLRRPMLQQTAPPPAEPLVRSLEKITTSNIGKYSLGQTLSSAGGYIVQIIPDMPGANTGKGLLVIATDKPLGTANSALGGVKPILQTTPRTSALGKQASRMVPFVPFSLKSGVTSNPSQTSEILKIFGDAAELKLGELFEDQLASKGTTKVYHGKGTYYNTPVAIKKIVGPDGEHGALQEAKQMVNLRHPNIVRFFALVKQPQMASVSFVTELTEGGSFRNLIDSRHPSRVSSGPSSKREGRPIATMGVKTKIIMQLVAGLNYLHHHGMIHRNLHADNIMLDSENNAKIGSFGDSVNTPQGQTAMPFTAFAGLVGWMAPEVLRAEDTYTSKVDVYALGMVIFEALTTEYPFDGLDLAQLKTKVGMEGKRPSSFWSPKSRGEELLHQTMVRCWAQDPRARPSLPELVEEMERVWDVAKTEDVARRTIGCTLRIDSGRYTQSCMRCCIHPLALSPSHPHTLVSQLGYQRRLLSAPRVPSALSVLYGHGRHRAAGGEGWAAATGGRNGTRAAE
jgi:serine/threonine protein kinase